MKDHKVWDTAFGFTGTLSENAQKYVLEALRDPAVSRMIICKPKELCVQRFCDREDPSTTKDGNVQGY